MKDYPKYGFRLKNGHAPSFIEIEGVRHYKGSFYYEQLIKAPFKYVDNYNYWTIGAIPIYECASLSIKKGDGSWGFKKIETK